MVIFFPCSNVPGALLNNSAISTVECVFTGSASTDSLQDAVTRWAREGVKKIISRYLSDDNTKLRTVKYFQKESPTSTTELFYTEPVQSIDNILKRNNKIFRERQQRAIVMFSCIKFGLRQGRDVASIIAKMVFKQNPEKY